jgi:DNA-directed RNA polymerase
VTLGRVYENDALCAIRFSVPSRNSTRVPQFDLSFCHAMIQRGLRRAFATVRATTLDLNVLDVARATHEAPQWTSKTYAKLNLFLSSLAHNDLPLSLKTIQRFKLRDSPPHATDSLHVQCVNILFLHLVSKGGSVHISMIKSALDHVIKDKCLLSSHTNQDAMVLRANIVRVLINCCQGHSGFPANREHLRYAIYVFKSLNIDIHALVGILDSSYLNAFERLFSYKLLTTKSAQSQSFDIEPRETTLDAFVNLVSRRFPPLIHDPRPMYKVFEQESGEFWRQYQEFNRRKQFEIEQCCRDLVPEVFRTKTRRLMTKFNQRHFEMVALWVTTVTDQVVRLIGHEHSLAKFSYILLVLPLDSLVEKVVSTVMRKTLLEKQGYAVLVDTARSCAGTIERMLNKQHQPPVVFSQDIGLELSCALIDIVVHSCRLTPHQVQEHRDKWDTTYLPDEQPWHSLAFAYDYQHALNSTSLPFKRAKVIQAHPYLRQLLLDIDSFVTKQEIFIPMLVEPNPWTLPRCGGYLTNLKSFMLTNDSASHLAYLQRADKAGQLTSVYQSLTTLGKMAWTINADVLQVFLGKLQQLQGFLTVPPSLAHIKMPTKPQPGSSRLQVKEYKREMQLYHNLRSERFKYDHIGKIAKALGQNGDCLYIPYGVDFRGRIYPLTTVLNIHSEDLVRSLLMFWEAKPLGANGLNWLKYQLAGVYGYDKLRASDRIAWCDANMNKILSGDSQWWQAAEKPWQTLALCQELVKVDEFVRNGGAAADFKTRIAIHQDGSCNGLQHYAALGLDYAGGEAVNLVPHNHRRDIYSTVLGVVRRQIEVDLEDPAKCNIAALSLKVLSRKIVKQTVMTSVYGVTTFGAFRQIRDRIEELVDKMRRFSDTEHLNARVNQLLHYLTSLTLKSIGELFLKAKLIQDWLLISCVFVNQSVDLNTLAHKEQSTAGGVSFFDNQFFKPMMWTSMSGLPIVQLYMKKSFKLLKVASGTIKIERTNVINPINARKQLNAVAPNFIHSIDSIHLQMSCLKAHALHMTFAAVHDSFWTHPCDVDKLNEIIRAEFVTLHTSGIVENLRDDLLYTTRNSLNLVYVKRSDNPVFIHHLRARRLVSSGQILSIAQYNKILYQEAHELFHGKAQDFEALLQTYDPITYFKLSPCKCIVYSEDTSVKDIREMSITLKDFEPILVPVKMLRPPPRGHLDIEGVKANEFFFS